MRNILVVASPRLFPVGYHFVLHRQLPSLGFTFSCFLLTWVYFLSATTKMSIKIQGHL